VVDGPLLVINTGDGDDYTKVAPTHEWAKQINLRNRVNLEHLAELTSALKALQSNIQATQLFQEVSALNRQFRVSLPQIPARSTVELEAFRTLGENLQQVTAAPFLEGWKSITAAAATAARSLTEYLQFIQFSIPRIDPLWIDISLAQDGNPEAAGRLASRISWRSEQWQKDAIRLRARSLGRSPQEVHQEAMRQGVLMALQWQGTDKFPFLVRPKSTWLYDDEHSLATVCPLDLPLQLLWHWIQQEAVRAAGLWLVGQSYAPTIVLEEPPGEDGELRLARFTSDSASNSEIVNQGGRPFGSGIFESRGAFLREIRLAAAELEKRGDRVTQEGVASILSHKSLLGSGAPDRQLRFWVKQFGFDGWKDLKRYL
jgi:hypothetical protein